MFAEKSDIPQHQIHDRCCEARARGREEEGPAQVVFASDGQSVAQQHFHSTSPHQWKPHPSCHPTHYPFLFLSQQYTNRYMTTLDTPAFGVFNNFIHCVVHL